jgi:hypothetical protein
LEVVTYSKLPARDIADAAAELAMRVALGADARLLLQRQSASTDLHERLQDVKILQMRFVATQDGTW